MYTITLTKYNTYGGLIETQYNDIAKYRITDDLLILEDSKMRGSYYIPRKEVLEFEVTRQV